MCAETLRVMDLQQGVMVACRAGEQYLGSTVGFLTWEQSYLGSRSTKVRMEFGIEVPTRQLSGCQAVIER